jgi:hypothetical protein
VLRLYLDNVQVKQSLFTTSKKYDLRHPHVDSEANGRDSDRKTKTKLNEKLKRPADMFSVMIMRQKWAYDTVTCLVYRNPFFLYLVSRKLRLLGFVSFHNWTRVIVNRKLSSESSCESSASRGTTMTQKECARYDALTCFFSDILHKAYSSSRV